MPLAWKQKTILDKKVSLVSAVSQLIVDLTLEEYWKAALLSVSRAGLAFRNNWPELLARNSISEEPIQIVASVAFWARDPYLTRSPAITVRPGQRSMKVVLRCT